MPLKIIERIQGKKNINQQELGSMVDASRQTISLIERGDYSPSVTLALKIAGYFGVRVEDILNMRKEREKKMNEVRNEERTEEKGQEKIQKDWKRLKRG